jgi:hypothetical protein
VSNEPSRPWFAIGWLAAWGTFQAFAVASVLQGTWHRPAAFPAGLYEALIYPDMVFIPLYFVSAVLLYKRHWLGSVSALLASGGIVYVMIYLLALARLSGVVNVIGDGLFLAFTVVSIWQVVAFSRQQTARRGGDRTSAS